MKSSRIVLIGIGAVLALVHSVVVFGMTADILRNPASGMAIFLVIFLDAPVAWPLLLLSALPGVGSMLDGNSGTLFIGVYLGICGGVWWFLVPTLLRWSVDRFRRQGSSGMQIILALLFFVCLLVSCGPLLFIAMQVAIGILAG